MGSPRIYEATVGWSFVHLPWRHFALPQTNPKADRDNSDATSALMPAARGHNHCFLFSRHIHLLSKPMELDKGTRSKRYRSSCHHRGLAVADRDSGGKGCFSPPSGTYETQQLVQEDHKGHIIRNRYATTLQPEPDRIPGHIMHESCFPSLSNYSSSS